MEWFAPRSEIVALGTDNSRLSLVYSDSWEMNWSMELIRTKRVRMPSSMRIKTYRSSHSFVLATFDYQPRSSVILAVGVDISESRIVRSGIDGAFSIELADYPLIPWYPFECLRATEPALWMLFATIHHVFPTLFLSLYLEQRYLRYMLECATDIRRGIEEEKASFESGKSIFLLLLLLLIKMSEQAKQTHTQRRKDKEEAQQMKTKYISPNVRKN